MRTRVTSLPACLGLLLALVLLGGLVGPPVHAAPATAATAADREGEDQYLNPPSPGDDFPRLPTSCYESDGLTVKDQPCRVITFPGGRKRPVLLLWGDSQAWMYLPALRRLAKRTHVSLIVSIAGGCAPSLPAPGAKPVGNCENHNVKTLAFATRLHQRRDHFQVLVGGFWSGYRQAYRAVALEQAGGPDSGLTPYEEQRATRGEIGGPRFFTRMGQLRIDADVIGQTAVVPEGPPPCAAGREPYQCDLPRALAMNAEANNRRWLRTQMAHLVGKPRLIDATPAYCTPQVCRAHVGGVPTFFDDLHLGAALTKTMTAYFAATFDDLL